MTYDLVVKGGEIVSSGGAQRADVGVIGEHIAALGPGLSGREIVEATGKLVLPGVIDVHTHFSLPVSGTQTADDFASGSRAAAIGGVTTFLDFTAPSDAPTLVESVRSRRAIADPAVCIDYGLHAVSRGWDDAQRAEIPALLAAGVPSVKLFMVYRERGWQADDADLARALSDAAQHGLTVCVHAEDEERIAQLQADAGRQGVAGAAAHAWTRPGVTESAAVARALAAAEAVGGRLYLVHISAGDSIDAIAAARARGVDVHAETCPQYLLLDARLFERADGHRFATCPPLRTPADQARLWEALARGILEVVATDHCAFNRAQKDAWGGDYRRIPMGLPGTELLLTLLHSEGVVPGRLHLGQLAQLLCENPARLFGLWPRKGTIRVGSDADIVILDPERRMRLSAELLASASDDTPYAGMEVTGVPVCTILRGRTIVRERHFLGLPGEGRFLRRVPASGR